MTLNEIYKDLKKRGRQISPAAQFVKDLANITGKKEKTVSQWVYGCQQPGEEDKKLISKKLGIPISELFP